jgi:predicted nucleic acid-binding protein
MILVDTGPIVALFNPRDSDHQLCRITLQEIREPLVTTVPVLTEAFHILGPASHGAALVRDFITRGGLTAWHLNEETLQRAFELMQTYADHPMDLADASLVVAGETLRATTVFTIDRNDFLTYRARIGRSHRPFSLIPAP